MKKDWCLAETAAYIDMIGGVSGDMLLGAMVAVGLDLDQLQVELDKLPDRGYRLDKKLVTRGGLEATLVNVYLDDDGEQKRSWDDFYSSIDSSDLEDSDKRSIRPLEECVSWALAMTSRFRLPEPIRRADQLSHKSKRV